MPTKSMYFLVMVLLYVSQAAIIGLNAGAQYDTSSVALVKESGAKYVRLNFIVTSSQSGTSDPNFISMYDSIINAYRAANVTIYGLIGAQAVKQGYNRNDPGSFIDPFKTAASDIITRWQGVVKVYELFNEPNDWAGGTTAQMTPYWFAKLLQSVYEMKYYNHWPATLISGPLFSFDGTDASDYLYQTYVAGMTMLAWDWFHQYAGTYPLDGIGYHIYTTQGSTDPNTVASGINKNLNGIWQNGVLRGERYRFPNSDPGNKKLWVSEYGWGSTNVGEPGQATDLNTALGVFANAEHVEVSMWFTLEDWGSQGWGLLRGDGSQKPSWHTFRSWTKKIEQLQEE